MTMSSSEPTAAGAVRPGPAAEPAAGQGADTRMVRTWWDVVLGGILVGTGVVVLGDVVVATVISVLFLGWTLVIGGAISIVTSLFRIRRGGFWVGMLGGVLALVAGVVFLRRPGATLLALSLAIGAVMLVSGITRLVAAVQHREARLALLLSGVLSIVLGLFVLGRWPTSALWLVGTLLGIQLIVDGMVLILVGRLRPFLG
jgi:membrane protein HdeD